LSNDVKPDVPTDPAQAAPPAPAASHVHTPHPATPPGPGSAEGYAEGASATYATAVQGGIAVKTAVQAVEAAHQGDVKTAVVDTTGVAINAGSAFVGGTQLVASNPSVLTTVATKLNFATAEEVTQATGRVANFAEQYHLGTAGEVLGVAADLTNAGRAALQGKDSDAAMNNAVESLGKAAITRVAVSSLGVGATGFITAGSNAMTNYETRLDAQEAMDRIRPDTQNQTNLRHMVDELKAKTVTDPATHQQKPAYPDLQHLAVDGKGQVDLANPSNQTKIKAALTAEDKALTAVVDDKGDHFVMPVPVIGNVHIKPLDGLHTGTDVLSDAGRDPVAAKAAATAEVQRKRIEVSMSELDNAADGSKFTRIPGRTAAQQHDDVVLAQREQGAHLDEQMVRVTAGPGGKLVGDDRKQPLPADMVSAFRADPTHNQVWEVPLYKKGPDGKPVLDAKGNPEVGKIMRYEIDVPGGKGEKPSGSQWAMTQSEQLAAFGASWRAEAKSEVNDKHQDFLKAAKSFAAGDPKVSQEDLMHKYEAYHDSLKDLKARAPSIGMNVKEVDAEMKAAGKELNSAFAPALAAAQAAGMHAPTVTVSANTAPPPATAPKRSGPGMGPG
jgi:hypothetical protein